MEHVNKARAGDADAETASDRHFRICNSSTHATRAPRRPDWRGQRLIDRYSSQGSAEAPTGAPTGDLRENYSPINSHIDLLSVILLIQPPASLLHVIFLGERVHAHALARGDTATPTRSPSSHSRGSRTTGDPTAHEHFRDTLQLPRLLSNSIEEGHRERATPQSVTQSDTFPTTPRRECIRLHGNKRAEHG